MIHLCCSFIFADKFHYVVGDGQSDNSSCHLVTLIQFRKLRIVPMECIPFEFRIVYFTLCQT